MLEFQSQIHFKKIQSWLEEHYDFHFEQESVQNGVFSLYYFLGEETRKVITRLKGFGSG